MAPEFAATRPGQHRNTVGQVRDWLLTPSRHWYLLFGLGLVQAVIYGGIEHLSWAFSAGGELTARPILQVVALFLCAFLLYLASVALLWNFRGPLRERRVIMPGKRSFTTLIVAFAVVFRLILWWSHPIQEDDYFRYLWDGRVLKEGISPYRFSPAAIESVEGQSSPSADLKHLVVLSHRSASVQTIFSNIGHREVPTIYPPLSQGIFALSAVLTPEPAPVIVHVRVLKLLILAFDIGTVLLLGAILRTIGWPIGRLVAYAWCPLVLKEFANSAHMDSIAVCLVTGTLWLLVRHDQHGASRASASGITRARRLGLDCLAAGVLAGATLAKLYPLVLAPVVLSWWWRRLRWRFVIPLTVFALTVAAGYLPIKIHDWCQRQGTADAAALTSSFVGLGEFARRWEMNDLLFAVVRENLKPPPGEETRIANTTHSEMKPWFVVMPASWRLLLNRNASAIIEDFGLGALRLDASFFFTQVFFGGMIVVLCVWLAFRPWSEHPQRDLLRRVFLSLAWLWFCIHTQNPWYWTWAMPFVVFASRGWLLVSGFALLYYVRFWLIHHIHEPMLLGGDYDGRRFFDEVAVWVEHLPCLAVLALPIVRKRMHQTNGDHGSVDHS